MRRTLNFYLRKHPAERGNARSRQTEPREGSAVLLDNAGRSEHVSKLDYHEAIQTLARRVAEECGGHCMRKAATGHRLTTAGIAGDTRSEPFSEHTPHATHKPDTKLEGENARAK